MVKKKVCARCKKDKLYKYFRPNRARKDGLQGYCIRCDKNGQKEWYRRNKNSIAAIRAQRKAEHRDSIEQFIVAYLSTHTCIDCPETDILVLDFDHVDRADKEINISQIIAYGWSLSRMQTEIDKCVVRCSNCHRRRTARQLNWWKMRYVPVAERIG